jgi:hypothetical protein
VTDLGRPVGEAQWLPDIDIFLTRCIEECRMNVQLAELEVHGGRNGEKQAHASHSDDWREGLYIVKACALAASLGDKPGFAARDIPSKVGLYLIDLHDVYDCTTRREVNEFPRAVGNEGVILMLHGHMPFSGLIAGESGTVRGRFNAISRGKEGNRRAGRLVRRGSNCESQVGLFDDVFFCNTLLWVIARSDEDRWKD